MSEPKNFAVDAQAFALAVVQSVDVNGDSPESIAEQKLELYLAAIAKVVEHNQPILDARKKASKEKNRNNRRVVNNLDL
ncbi:hypothetical protein SporoP37_15695 [Sporosarcina sp. P37]|uniref:hypothetical protein n=1 Tax=unclassified Sporosarcina TaxID=2647733 RepID=UPI000A17DB86|nr:MULTISPECIES: hypothetical protein [unclassified Sporosarcina]ARK25971.1 hypothetical protein SporoP37_15695 [Sporosarcina sp. P37]PID19339.1 hypothetical protein CSV62_02215 [Sporosarcina sp. P35]